MDASLSTCFMEQLPREVSRTSAFTQLAPHEVLMLCTLAYSAEGQNSCFLGAHTVNRKFFQFSAGAM